MTMTLSDVYAHCESNKNSEGICQINSACLGPKQSNLAKDYPMPKNTVVYRGEKNNDCRFEVHEVGSVTVGIVVEEE